MHFCPLQGAKLQKITDICKFYPQKITFYLYFFHFFSNRATLKQHFSPRRNKKPPCDRRFFVYSCRDYFSRSFSRSRRLDSFTILSMRSCILCPGFGHGSSNTVTFIISNVYLFFHCFNHIVPIRPIVSGRRVINAQCMHYMSAWQCIIAYIFVLYIS